MPEQERIYIGNVVLDEDNQEMLKQWLLDIINSLQGHGNGFDADTVDGFHATDFATAEQGLLAETSLQEGLTIGSTTLMNTTETQYIRSDGVKIDQELYDAFHGIFNTIDMDTLISTLIIKVYRKLQADITTLDENKVDKVPGKQLSTHDFNDHYKDMLDELDIAYIDILCPNSTNPSEQVVKRVLNAGSVNHLQFILTTEELYAQYTTAVKNAWNNIFIFVDEEDYPDDYESPLDCPIETGYVFRIDDREDEVWLQFKGRNAKNWIDMIKITDLYNQFLKYGNFENIMREIAAVVTQAAIAEIDTPEHINALIKRIDAPGIDHWKDYPFLSSELEFVYDVINDGRSLCSLDSNGFLIADVSNLTTEVENQLQSLQNSYGILSNTVATLNNTCIKKSDIQKSLNNNSDFPASTTVVKAKTDQLTEQYNNLQSQINSLSSTISNLNQITEQMKYFQKYIVLGVGQYAGVKRSTFKTPTDQKQDTLGSYTVSGRLGYGDNVPAEASLSVTNRGNLKVNGDFKHSDPDYIYARLIQEHTGEPASYNYDRYMFFQINGVFYGRRIRPGDDYATLNIRLNPGTYQITALYIDTFGDYQHPISITQQLVVDQYYK